ncbi:MAG: hypothetical protein MHPSP_002158 [Paramarteilia canceri]
MNKLNQTISAIIVPKKSSKNLLDTIKNITIFVSFVIALMLSAQNSRKDRLKCTLHPHLQVFKNYVHDICYTNPLYDVRSYLDRNPESKGCYPKTAICKVDSDNGERQYYLECSLLFNVLLYYMLESLKSLTIVGLVVAIITVINQFSCYRRPGNNLFLEMVEKIKGKKIRSYFENNILKT